MEPFDLALLGTTDPEDPKFQTFLYFETKQDYLDWRVDWRERYADLSKTIREERKAWRAEGSDHDPKLHHSLFRHRAEARTMLDLRKASKVKAERLYQQSKAVVEVA